METPSTLELLPETPEAAARQPRPVSNPCGAGVPLPAVNDDCTPASSRRRAEPPGPPIAHQGQRRRALLAAGVVTLAALVVGARYYVSVHGHEAMDDAFVGGPIVHVAPQVAGRVLQVFITANQPVQAGDLLVELDPGDFLVKLVQASAAAAEARGRLDQARWQLLVAEATQALAEAEVVAVQAHGRHAAAKRPAAQLKLTVAQLKEAAAEAQVNLARAQIETATASAVAAETAVEQAQLQLAYTEVRAPRSGRVRTQNVEPGEYVQVGQELLVLVSDDLGGPANLKEAQPTYRRPGQPAVIHVDDAQRPQYVAEDVLVQGDQLLAVDLIATDKALGGGWKTPGAQGAAR